jgi:hypothetical protein
MLIRKYFIRKKIRLVIRFNDHYLIDYFYFMPEFKFMTGVIPLIVKVKISITNFKFITCSFSLVIVF